MRHAHYGKVIHITEVFGALPCKDLARHEEYQTKNGRCWLCEGRWRESLPWVRPGLKQMHFDDDEGVLAFLKAGDDLLKKNRRTVVYRNCWEQDGPGFEHYVCEFFGVELGESKDPESYPFWHLTVEDKPNLIIPILRQRICYEPQITECPIYLEIIFQGFDYEIRFCGLDRDLDIRDQDLTPLLRARAFLFDQGSLARHVPKKRGGPHNVKARNWPRDVKENLGRRYVELKPILKWVKREAKTLLKLHGEGWGEQLLKMYSVLENNPDLLKEVDPFGVPTNFDGSGKKDPWEIAIEIAARETVPGYKEGQIADPKTRVSAESLRNNAILPEADK